METPSSLLLLVMGGPLYPVTLGLMAWLVSRNGKLGFLTSQGMLKLRRVIRETIILYSPPDDPSCVISA